MGEAAGTAVSLAHKSGKNVHTIDIGLLRNKLKDIKDSMIKNYKAGKLQVRGKYTFILPDFSPICKRDYKKGSAFFGRTLLCISFISLRRRGR